MTTETAIEYRAISGLETRAAPDASGLLGMLRGYAAKFNADSLPFSGYDGPWVERIAPGAFKRTLVESPDVVCLWSHDTSSPVARSPQTLALREDDVGLVCDISLVDTALNRDLLARVKAGIVRGMSFGFMPVKTEWKVSQSADAPDIRTLLDVDLMEISAVVWPAYPDTELGARSHRELRKVCGTAQDLKTVMQERAAFVLPAPVFAPSPHIAEARRKIFQLNA